MRKLNYVAALCSVFVSCTSLSAQDLNLVELKFEDQIAEYHLVKLDSTNSTSCFTVKGANQSASQNQNDTYVFPSSGRRLRRYIRSSVGPVALLKSAASAGVRQWNDSPEEWGQGAKGYGRRFGSSLGSNVIRQTFVYGLSEALHLDTGFEKSKRKGFWPRLSDALVQNVTSRTRSGKRVVSVPVFAGAYAGAIIPAETWYPERYSYKDGLRSGTYSLAGGFVINSVREFLFNW